MNTFIRNHQYNLIKKQAGLVQHALTSVSDRRVSESVRLGACAAIAEAFPDASKEQLDLLGKLEDLRTSEEIDGYMLSLEPYLAPFPLISPKDAARLFPKVKKLKTPDFAAIDRRLLTYAGWTDIATGRMFLVYELDGKFAGIEGRFTPARKGVCFLCNRHQELALFSAVSKVKPANVSPDYYKAFGQYICSDSEACNHHIKDVTALENFFHLVLG
ncbi:elongation factor G-binding protein [Paenibacillus sp. 1011MAR3C5]|uniref:FusB/FusC family EF-G-binding protein n=1 Tax=Paenibacillus sp. 1011MAR3C5 TaxID=1675787 RepID=UPI000E6C7EED|nr:FusB/FusC family EF-G-binding protein [Paenibacillus sp. 1011MAR3C5]RJE89630.1 elongation factor G-binding protein [Paenibacillus sp. 1011MAR3C5]